LGVVSPDGALPGEPVAGRTSKASPEGATEHRNGTGRNEQKTDPQMLPSLRYHIGRAVLKGIDWDPAGRSVIHSPVKIQYHNLYIQFVPIKI
jgi:hypothetical protein